MTTRKTERPKHVKAMEDVEKNVVPLEKTNAGQYSKDMIKEEKKYSVPYTSEKQKVVKETRYKNGVVKNKLVGMFKRGKLMFGEKA